MARGGGHHSHHSSHHAHHSYHSQHYYHCGRSVYGGGNRGKTDEERRRERIQTIIFVVIYFLIIFCLEMDLSFAKIFSLPKSPLPANAVNKTVYYTDEYGYVKDAEVLTEGMEYFFEKTGVQPYVYYTDMQSFYGKYYTMSGMNSLYGDLFDDEGHFLLIITGDITEYASHNVAYYYGADVDQVMDEAAIDQFFDNFDAEASRQTSADAVISNAFRKTAGDLRGVRAYGMGYIILSVLFLAAIAACIAAFVQRTRQRKMDQVIKNSKDHDQILFDDMPEELHAPERMVGDAVKKAEMLAEKESGQKEVWGPTISWDDALKDMQESEEETTTEKNTAATMSCNADMGSIPSEKADQKERGRSEKTALKDKTAAVFEEKQTSVPAEERTDQETNTEIQNDNGYIPSVDWGFSMDKGIDLFADEEKNDKK